MKLTLIVIAVSLFSYVTVEPVSTSQCPYITNQNSYNQIAGDKLAEVFKDYLRGKGCSNEDIRNIEQKSL
jgi:hypothetical protein